MERTELSLRTGGLGSMDVPIRGLVKDTDRHGNVRWYIRMRGRPKVRLREPYGSDAFHEEARCARLGLAYREAPAPEPTIAAQPGSLKWLTLEYLRSGCVGMSKGTVNAKRLALEAICDRGVLGSTKGATYGRLPLRMLQAADVEHLRDARAHIPEGADYWVKTISAMFGWAMDARRGGRPLALVNPAAGVKKFRRPSDGYHTWTLSEIAAYRARHLPGSQADLALRLILCTGLRVSDVAKLGRQHLYQRSIEGPDGEPVLQRRFRLMPRKTAKSEVVVDMEIMPPLAEAIDRLPKTQLIFLQSNRGRAYSDKSLSNMVRDWAAQAKLPPYCSAHGLRKAMATILAEGGASDRQLMALLGWTTAAQAETYTRAAERRKLSDEGMKHLKLG